MNAANWNHIVGRTCNAICCKEEERRDCFDNKWGALVCNSIWNSKTQNKSFTLYILGYCSMWHWSSLNIPARYVSALAIMESNPWNQITHVESDASYKETAEDNITAASFLTSSFPSQLSMLLLASYRSHCILYNASIGNTYCQRSQ